MTALRAMLIVLWLLMAVTAPAHASPASGPSCHAMTTGHHGRSMPVSPDAAMPCCSQPAIPAAPETVILAVPSERPAGLVPAKTRLPSGLSPETAPHPPRSL